MSELPPDNMYNRYWQYFELIEQFECGEDENGNWDGTIGFSFPLYGIPKEQNESSILKYKPDMIPYEQTKAGWDKAAVNHPDSAIHPSGLKGREVYEATGLNDANLVTNTICEYIHEEQPMPVWASIIDFGCGNGRVTIPIAKEFKKVYAVDFSYAMLQQLPKDTNIQPVLSTDNWFGLSEPADYAFSISVFIHNTYDSGVKIMRAIGDNLKPSGLALLQIPIYEHARTPMSYIDVGVWTIEGFEAAAHKTGFEIMEVYTNRGHFDYGHIGSNHYKFQILRKK